MKTVSILGTEYQITFNSKTEDKALEDCDGYCDHSTKRIVVTNDNVDLGDFLSYQKQCVRHELTHAFMYESGLSANWEHKPFGQSETVVDWLAIQFPKLLKAFEEAGAL